MANGTPSAGSSASALLSSAQPRWATERTDRPTRGDTAAMVAAKLGFGLMPWQRQVLDTALEVNPETGKLAYRQVMVTCPRQAGKGLSEDERLPTPDGWVRMGDIQPGQVLFDETGSQCRVTAVSERRMLDCYRVHFSDGTSIVADGDHLWHVYDTFAYGGIDESKPDKASGRYQQGAWRTVETREMAGKANPGKKKRPRYLVPDSPTLDLPDADLLIDPWVLGCWLGDGSRSTAMGTCAEWDLDEMVSGFEAAGYYVTSTWKRPETNAWQFRWSTSPVRGNRWPDSDSGRRRLRDLGVFCNKHIPDVYLRGSAEQRLAVVQGLMDTDGTVVVGGNNKTSRVCEFTNTNEQIINQFVELIRSLGIRTVVRESVATLNGRVTGPQWRIQFTTDLPVFRLKRKAEILASGGERRKRARTISSIGRIPTVPTRCIRVDSPSNLFLAGEGMVPTHNSTLTFALMLTRCVSHADQQRIVYTAQDGRSATEKFEEDFCSQLRLTKGLVEGRDYRVRLSNGHERVLWTQNGSILRPSATTPNAGHGKVLDLAIVDEAFAHRDLRIDQSFGPPMITRPEPQLWIVSTAGTWESVYFNTKRAAGRAAVERGDTDAFAYFEWSAPDDADLWDRDVWRATHPALGHTITEEALAAEISKMVADPEEGESEARRAYYNQTREKREVESIIDRDAWLAQIDEKSKIAPTAQAALAVDMPPDCSR